MAQVAERPLRIAITTLTTPAQPLGVGRYLISLINALQEIDRKNEYLIYTSSDNYHLFDLWAENFVEVRTAFHHEPRWVMRPLYFIWQNSWLLWSLRAKKVDLFHLPNLLPLFARTVPSVVTIHDLGEFKTEKKYGALRLWYRKSVLPITIRNASRVITVSQSTRSDLINILDIPENKIDITYEGVARAFSEATGDNGSTVREKYTDAPYIFYAGAMYKHKNLARLVQAFEHFKRTSGLPHKLVIAGRHVGDYEQLVSLVAQLNLVDDVIFTGYVSDQEIISLYRAASLVAYVPLNEGFGLPILEAMSCDTPVIASNVSSIPEVAGDAARLVNPLDVEAIADAMVTVLTNEPLREEMIAKGKKQLEKFSWERCAQETLETYRLAGQN